MPWFKVDDSLHSSKKFLSIPARQRFAAIGLWTVAGSWSAGQLTDGVIPKYMLKAWGATEKTAQALVEAGLWDDEQDSFEFRSWLEYQPSKARVEADRAASKARMKAKRTSNKTEEPQDHAENEDVFGRTFSYHQEGVRLPRPDPTRPDQEPKGSSLGAKAKRDMPLPDDWTPTPEHRQRALDEGLDLDREVIKFREHAKEKGRKAKNWNSAFARWLINAGEYKQTRSPNGGGFSSARNPVHDAIDLAKELFERETRLEIES